MENPRICKLLIYGKGIFSREKEESEEFPILFTLEQ